MKFNIPVLFVLLLWPFLARTQVEFSPKVFDYGEVEKWKNPPATFIVTNTGSEPFTFLPTFPTNDLLLVLPKGKIAPGQTVEIRAFYYTGSTGEFSKDIAVYVTTSQTAYSLKIRGKIKSIDSSADLSCPGFAPKTIEDTYFEASIKTIDALTKQPIGETKIVIEDMGGDKDKARTDVNGMLVMEMPPGKYFIDAEKEGYLPAGLSSYLNKLNPSVVLELTPLEETVPPPLVQGPPPPAQRAEVIPDDLPEPPADPDGTLPVNLYAANNVVFLLDVSSSMKGKDKLPLLKSSMKDLAKVLRNIDRLTIVAYSSDAQVALPATSANYKSVIYAAIDSLQAKGWTFGVKGLEKAYEIAGENYISGGNNQIILATDGLFNHPNFSEKEMFSMVRDKTGDGVILSVIGFGDDREAENRMKKLARQGNGNYLKMQAGTNKDVLVEEIKLHSATK